jgi:4-hydroxy-3-methylbut-2-enyl diphosphate reductase
MVVRQLTEQGVDTVSSVAKAPGGTVIISAHGAPPVWFKEARERGLKVIDATCPLVIRIHRIIHRLIKDGYNVIHFGDIDHDETKGVVGQAPEGRVIVVRNLGELRKLHGNGKRLALTSQTTVGVSDFENISAEAAHLFPGIEVFNTICNATSQRQAAVMALAPKVELMLIVGSHSSANSKRLRNISEKICGRALLINTADDLDANRLNGIEMVGLSAGASTPDFLVEAVINRLIELSGNKAKVIRPSKKQRRGTTKKIIAEIEDNDEI